MGYLILAIVSSTLVSVCMRCSERCVTNQMGMFAANYAVCSLLSAAFAGADGLRQPHAALLRIVVLGAASGVLYLVSFLFMKLNMRHNGMVLTATFMKLGVLIPTAMAVAVFREVPRMPQMLGFALALAAIVLLHFDRNALQQGGKMGWLMLLLVLSGATDSMANVFEQLSGGAGKDLYLVVTFLAAFGLALGGSLRGTVPVKRQDLLWGMLIGVPNYFSSRFLLLALGHLQAVVVYPVYSVGTLIAISLIGAAVFREVLNARKYAAFGLIILALTLLNL